LYRIQNGYPAAVDPNNPLPPAFDPPSQSTLDLFSRLRRKGFTLEGKLRSPWYDKQCDRANSTPLSIAQEQDLDYGGSQQRIFGTHFFEKANATILTPRLTGILSYHPETLEPEFDITSDGLAKLWVGLDHKFKPPHGKYVVSADISTGLGGSYTSNSVAQVIDIQKLEQVFEFATNSIEPADFADYCIALSKLFHGAYLAWEKNGPGEGFTKQVLSRGYENFYYRTVLWKRKGKKTKEPGWLTDKKTKRVMFSELSRAVRNSKLILHSSEVVDECGQYIIDGSSIEHNKSKKAADPGSRDESHGDRVMALGVGLMAALDRPVLKSTTAADLLDTAEPGTFAARQKEYDDRLKSKDGVWDGRDNWDIARGKHEERSLEGHAT